MPDPDKLSISASESPALFGVSPYLTRWMLWQKFVNGVEPERATNNRMEWGKKLEFPIMGAVGEERDMRVEANHESYMRRGLLGCTRDAMIMSPEHGIGPLEIKCVFDYEQWGRKWDNGQTVPRDIEIQLQQQMYVGDGNTPFQWGLIVVWVCADLHYFERRPIPSLWTALERAAIGFFSDVRSRREPNPSGAAVELPLLQQLFPTRPASVLDLSADQDHVKTSEDVSMFKTMKEQKDGAASVYDELRIKLIALAKDNEFIKLPCGVSYRVKKSGKGKTIEPFVPDVPSAWAPL